MLYPYITFSDETEVLHSQVIDEGGMQVIEVHFERPTEEGFDTARFRLPEYTLMKREGYSDEEISSFEKFLHSNAHLLYKYAAIGGISIA